jgi:hypothetical protein
MPTHPPLVMPLDHGCRWNAGGTWLSRPPALRPGAALGAGGREYLLSCHIGGRCALPARGASGNGLELLARYGSRGAWRLCQGALAPFAALQELGSPAHPPFGLAQLVWGREYLLSCNVGRQRALAARERGGWVGQVLKGNKDAQRGLAAKDAAITGQGVAPRRAFGNGGFGLGLLERTEGNAPAFCQLLPGVPVVLQ